jgi:hypothetical protein
MRASPILSSFNGGELSPRLEGRTEYEKYQTGCSVLSNFIPTVQGPAVFRAGCRYTADVLLPAYRSWLSRFEFNYAQAFVLEWTHLALAFLTNRGRLLDEGISYQIVTPYAAADLVNSDGGFALSLVQTNDIVYIAGGNKPPQKLSRLGNTNWTIAEFQPAAGPFMDANLVTTDTIYASAQTGSVTLTANTARFTDAHVGALIRLEMQSPALVPPWEPDKAINLAELRRSDGKTYKCTIAGTTGTIKPTHDSGKSLDGSNASRQVEWEYQDAGYGVARITAVTDSTHATATVITKLPDGVTTSGGTTWRWLWGAWGAHNEYPTKVSLYRDRLVWTGARSVWMSVAGDYENYAPDDAGQQTDESAITIRPASGEANQIRWLQSADALLIGTAGAEFAIGPQTTSDPLGPANVKAVIQSGFGGRALPAPRVGESVFFVDKTGRKVREVRYNVDTGLYAAADLTVLAEHITEGGLIDLAWQQSPESILWAVRADGVLIGLTYEREQNVYGWHPHPMGGSAVVESIACIPSPDGTQDDLWLAIRRTVNGTTLRTLERMERAHRRGDDPADAFYVDCGLTYDGAAATTISGLEHLEGQTVTVVVDGAAHPSRTVEAGAITLQLAGSVVHVGLPYLGRMRPMRLDAGSQEGSAQGKTKRMTKVTIRVLDSLGGKAGPTWAVMDRLQMRRGSSPMDGPPPLFSGDVLLSWPAGYETDGYICIEQDQPFPFTVAALVPTLQGQDR